MLHYTMSIFSATAPIRMDFLSFLLLTDQVVLSPSQLDQRALFFAFHVRLLVLRFWFYLQFLCPDTLADGS